jgi:hypothetical protein
MLDPAPGLFSTMNCWPMKGSAPLAKVRPMMSEAAPGVKPMMRWIGRVG